MIIMHILGKPIPWKRPAHKVLNGKVWVFDSQKKEKEQCRWQMRSYVPSGQLLTCPCAIEFIFSFNVPDTVSRATRRQMLAGEIKHFKKPDLDNMQKFYLDAMNGFVFVDDCQVEEINAKKIWSESEGTKIIIKPRHLHKDLGPSTILDELDLPPDFLELDYTQEYTQEPDGTDNANN